MCSRAARRSRRSTSPSRIAENFDFQLSGSELTAIDALDTGIRGGLEPDAVTLEVFGRHSKVCSTGRSGAMRHVDMTRRHRRPSGTGAVDRVKSRTPARPVAAEVRNRGTS